MLKRILFVTMVILFAGMLCGCMSPKESFLKKGATLLTQQEIYDTLRGNTMVASDWAAYYREDGVRIVEAGWHGIARVSWRMNMGRFCQQSHTGKTYCNIKIYQLGDQYKIFAKNKVYSFKVKKGNAHDLK